jgi:methylmalonyl-CoA mutase N-terminal domain/subunit
MWASISKDLGATNPKAMMLRFHTQTGGSTLQAQQAENNIVRVTLQALAAVMGGTQSLHTNGYDEALSLPTEAAARTALRTQQVIAFESGVIDTVDPLAGSYFVENLTNEIEKKAWEYIAKIDAMGGSVSAIEQGYMQREISDAAYKYQKEIENNERVIVGVNKFTVKEEVAPPVFKIDESIRVSQTEKLKQLRSERDAAKFSAAMANLESATKEGRNVMPYIIDAVSEYATLGEIADTFRNIFGEYRA